MGARRVTGGQAESHASQGDHPPAEGADPTAPPASADRVEGTPRRAGREATLACKGVPVRDGSRTETAGSPNTVRQRGPRGPKSALGMNARSTPRSPRPCRCHGLSRHQRRIHCHRSSPARSTGAALQPQQRLGADGILSQLSPLGEAQKHEGVAAVDGLLHKCLGASDIPALSHFAVRHTSRVPPRSVACWRSASASAESPAWSRSRAVSRWAMRAADNCSQAPVSPRSACPRRVRPPEARRPPAGLR